MSESANEFEHEIPQSTASFVPLPPAPSSSEASSVQKKPAARRFRSGRGILVGVLLIAASLCVGFTPSPYVLKLPGVMINTRAAVAESGKTYEITTLEGETPTTTLSYNGVTYELASDLLTKAESVAQNRTEDQNLAESSETQTEEDLEAFNAELAEMEKTLAVTDGEHIAKGSLNLLTVRIEGETSRGVNWFNVFRALVDPSIDMVRIEEVFDPNLNDEEQKKVFARQMRESQNVSISAAYHYLKQNLPAQMLVSGISEEGQKNGNPLQAGDVVLALNGQKLTANNLSALLNLNGQNVQVVYYSPRDKQVHEATVKPYLENNQKWRMGIFFESEFLFPKQVKFLIDGIGGPSAGMIFTISLIEQLSGENIVGDLGVSGTGTITPTGQVGPIGGIRQKAVAADRAGTELFIFPKDNCEEFDSIQESFSMRSVPVSTVDEAIEEIRNFRETGTVTRSCPR